MACRLNLRFLQLAWLLLAALPGMAQGQGIDPTRPAVGATTGIQPGGEADIEGAAADAGLQSVILRKSGKPAALINGTVVELGGRVGESRLVKVGEDHVVLRGPQGDETLRLMPAVEKKLTQVEKIGDSAVPKGKLKKREVAP